MKTERMLKINIVNKFESFQAFLGLALIRDPAPTDVSSLPRTTVRETDRRLLLLALVVLTAVASLRSQTAPVSSSRIGENQRLYQTGLSLVRRGHIDEAIIAFKTALQSTPQDKVLLDATGAAYSVKGDLNEARSYFLASLKVDPEFEPAKFNLAITLFGLRRYEESKKRFKSLNSHTAHSLAVTNLFLGMIAEKQAECVTAVTLLHKAGPLLDQYPDSLLSFASCQLQLGDRPAALQALAHIDRAPGVSAAQYEQAGDLYARLGQNQRALADLNRSRSDKTKSVGIEKKRAEFLERAGRLEEAQELLEKLTELHATEDLLLDLARVAKDRGDIAVAMKSLRRASEIEPDREDSYLEFSTICSDNGNNALALETAEIGLSHVPNSYRLTVQKGAVLEKLGRLKDAEAALRSSVRLQKDNSIALLSLAVVLAHEGKIDEAEQILTTSIQKFPNNYYMYYFQGKLLLQFGNHSLSNEDLRKLALRSLEQSIKLNPNYADAYYQLSEVYLVTSPKLAEQTLKKCLQLDPKYIPAQYSLARLYLRTGRKAEGKTLLDRLKTQQLSEDQQQQKRLLIVAAQH